LAPIVFGTQSIKGVWWIPGSDEAKRVPGTLHLAANKFPRLELEGQIAAEPHYRLLAKLSEEARNGWPIKAIHGVTYDNQCAALLECFPQGTTSRSGGVHTETYVSRFALFGDHPETLDVVKSREVHILTTDLGRWSGVANTVVPTTETQQHVSIETRFPAPVVVAVPTLNATLRLQFYWRGSYGRHRANVEVTPRLSLIREDAVSLEEQINTINSLTTLISVCVGNLVSLQESQIEAPESEPDADPRSVVWPIRAYGDDEDISHWGVATTFGALSSLGDRWIDTWFQWSQNKRLAIRIVLNLLDDEASPAVALFVRTTQAAETFARLRYGEDKTIGEDGEKAVAVLIDAIPEGLDVRFTKRLRRYLTSFGRPSLGWYLGNLVRELDVQTAKAIGVSPAWAGKVAERRNSLVHKLTTGVEDGTEASTASRDTRRLILLILLCTLADLGILPAEALKGFGWHSWVRQIKMYADATR
jgi:hypothetical protein